MEGKEKILEYLAEKEWDEEFTERIICAVAPYVVYQMDPDDSTNVYGHQYHFTKESAMADYNARTYVPTGRWCYCCVSEIWGDFIESREISDPCSIWD